MVTPLLQLLLGRRLHLSADEIAGLTQDEGLALLEAKEPKVVVKPLKRLTVVFTGFDSDRLELLTVLAHSNGLGVMEEVTPSLALVVIGPQSDLTKVMDAGRNRNTRLISEQQFRYLILEACDEKAHA